MSFALNMALLLAVAQTPAAPPPPTPTERREERHVIIINDDGPGGPGGPGGHRGPRDADSDGFVSRDEFVAPMARMFERLDTNHDGKLSPAELADAPPPPHGPHHGPGGPGEHGGPGGPGEDVRIEIRRFGGPGGDLDANNDGKVTEDEFIAPLRDAFRRMDADHSGDLGEGERGSREETIVETIEAP